MSWRALAVGTHNWTVPHWHAHTALAPPEGRDWSERLIEEPAVHETALSAISGHARCQKTRRSNWLVSR
jgi:hypothetical protein